MPSGVIVRRLRTEEHNVAVHKLADITAATKEGHKFGWCMDDFSPFSKEAKTGDVILVGDEVSKRMGGALVTAETRELKYVCGHGKVFHEIMMAAELLGARFLNCYNTGLVKMYRKYGWTVIDRKTFDPSLAPADIPAGLQPDLVWMEKIFEA